MKNPQSPVFLSSGPPREEDEIEEVVFQEAEEACLTSMNHIEAVAEVQSHVSPTKNTNTKSIMTSDNNMHDVEETFESLLQLSIYLDRDAHDLQRIAILSTKCSEEFPQIIVRSCPDYIITRPSQLQQRVKERESIRLQKRGGHTYRTSKQDKLVPGDDPPWLCREIRRQLRIDERNDVQSQRLDREIRRQLDPKKCSKPDPRWSNCGRHKYRYDPRIDTAPTEPYQCLYELQWLLKCQLPDADIQIDDNHLSKGDGKYTISKPLDSHYVINGIAHANETIGASFQDIKLDCFNCYLENKYHPLHQHGIILSNIQTKLKAITDDLQKQIDNNTPLDTICKYILNTVTPSLKTIAMEIRSNIIIFQKRPNDQKNYYYSKLHSVKIVTAYKKGTSERASAIRYMVNDRWVPSRKVLDKVIKLKESGCFFVEEEWNTDRGRQSRECILLENERYHSIINHLEEQSSTTSRKKRKNMSDVEKIIDTCMTKTHDEIEKYMRRGNNSEKFSLYGALAGKVVTNEVGKKKKLLEWEKKRGRNSRRKNTQYSHIGSLLLALHPVQVERPVGQYKVYGFESVPSVTTALYAPPEVIEVGNMLGLSAERLYFSPKQFPVTDLENAGDNEIFKQLKDYIVGQSLLAGNSPVVFHGTDFGRKRFICKYALEKNWKQKFGNTPFARCKFSFLVKWDKYGYYIHTSKPNPTYDEHDLIDRRFVVGCEFHNHSI